MLKKLSREPQISTELPTSNYYNPRAHIERKKFMPNADVHK
jgi:hypothetical protein